MDTAIADITDPTDRLASIIADLEVEQQRLVAASFDTAAAWDLGNVLVHIALDRGAAVTVDIRRHNQVLFHAALTGTSADNDRWVDRKSQTALHFGESSWLVRHRFLAQGQVFDVDSGLDPKLYAAHGGSVPIIVRGSGVMAAATVSGLPQDADHRLVVEGLLVFLSD